MPVYVDDMYLYPMGEFKRGPRTYKMSHMIADSLDELHAMADTIGVNRRWFQDKASGAHYDITMTKRKVAIAAGAIPISLQQCAAMSIVAARFGQPMPKPEVAESVLSQLRSRGKVDGHHDKGLGSPQGGDGPPAVVQG